MTIDDLAAYGANVEEGLKRCMGMTDFYVQLAGSIKTEQGFDKLNDEINAGDLDAAFQTAHGLKGILANLAITPLQEPVSEITELLRAKTDMDYSGLMAHIMEERDRFRAL